MKSTPLCLAVLAVTAVAQDGAPRAVIAPAESFRMTSRVAFLVDVSGSMHPAQREADALRAVLSILDAPTDDLEVACYAFADGVGRWPGVHDDDEPAGWARLPSRPTVDALQTWLAAQQTTAGSTDPATALEAAVQDAREGETLVMVTDGEFAPERAVAILGARPHPPLVVFAVARGETQPGARECAKAGGGGLWVIDASGPW